MALTNNFTNYSFARHTLALGPIIVDGYQEGEGFSIESTESFGKVVGADGKVTRYTMSDRSASITIKLLQTSATNDQFSALWNLAIRSKNGDDVLPLFIRDNSGRSVYKASQAWIRSAPTTVSFGTEPTGREWIIDCAVLERVDAGN